LRKIVVSGSHSNIGKTAVASCMLRTLENWSAIKITVKRDSGCPRHSSCGVCAGFKGDFDLIADKRIINQKGTDTARMKEAGAKKVVWLKASLRGLKSGFRKALQHLKGSEGVVIEGTSILRHI